MFIIDYSLAPEFPYPQALDDCWQAYNWILTEVNLYFNIHPTKIIFIGDSSGANLSISLTLWCIKKGFRIPDGLIPIYPSFILLLKKK